jgi:hypothetical protein
MPLKGSKVQEDTNNFQVENIIHFMREKDFESCY